MTLPEGVEGDRITADFENGLLEVTVKGAADYPEPERIRIGTSVG
jgi:HSP20 family molecular chaperone IbpA